MAYKNIYSTKIESESCVLVGLSLKKNLRAELEESLEELEALAHTAGAKVVDKFIQERISPDPAYFLGKGKAQEIADFVKAESIDMIIFDEELSPAQVRNWERMTEVKVLDRSALILDIFAQHARTRESRKQVELAQLSYLLPRLTRQWSHLSRQVGGIGTKGPGETQLETDRRLVRTRIGHLKTELSLIEKQRHTQRKKSGGMKRISIVGYTNAGKSTLLNTLTGAKALVENKLFATLDTTTRRLTLNDETTVLISDTVGFIRKLPHHLIASFHSTLAQTQEADVLIHVIDLNDIYYNDHIEVVKNLLVSLKIDDKPTLLVFNKVDLVEDNTIIVEAQQLYPQAYFVSAKKNIRLEKLKENLNSLIGKK